MITRPRRRFLTANANTSSFAAMTAATTEPDRDGIQVLAPNGQGVVPPWIVFWPFGLGSDNDAFSMRVWGWGRAFQESKDTLYVPSALAEVSCTCSAFVGVAGAAVLNTERFCDTIAVVATVGQPKHIDADSGGVSTRGFLVVFSPANDTPAWVAVPTMGAEKIELQFDQTTGTPTMNALYALSDMLPS